MQKMLCGALAKLSVVSRGAARMKKYKKIKLTEEQAEDVMNCIDFTRDNYEKKRMKAPNFMRALPRLRKQIAKQIWGIR